MLKGIKTVLRGLELSLNEDKTRVIDAKKQRFHFLGFTLEVKKNPRTGRMFPLITPSKEAMAKIKAEIKALTCRNNLKLPKEVLIGKLNALVRGWVGYFHYGNCSRDLTRLKEFLDERVRIYLRRKHAKKSRGYKVYPYRYLYDNLNPTTIHIKSSLPWPVSVSDGRDKPDGFSSVSMRQVQ